MQVGDHVEIMGGVAVTPEGEVGPLGSSLLGAVGRIVPHRQKVMCVSPYRIHHPFSHNYSRALEEADYGLVELVEGPYTGKRIQIDSLDLRPVSPLEMLGRQAE